MSGVVEHIRRNTRRAPECDGAVGYPAIRGNDGPRAWARRHRAKLGDHTSPGHVYTTIRSDGKKIAPRIVTVAGYLSSCASIKLDELGPSIRLVHVPKRVKVAV